MNNANSDTHDVDGDRCATPGWIVYSDDFLGDNLEAYKLVKLIGVCCNQSNCATLFIRL